MLLQDILREVNYFRVEGSLDKQIDGIFYDSRQVSGNALFFCIEGFRFDGHRVCPVKLQQEEPRLW